MRHPPSSLGARATRGHRPPASSQSTASPATTAGSYPPTGPTTVGASTKETSMARKKKIDPNEIYVCVSTFTNGDKLYIDGNTYRTAELGQVLEDARAFRAQNRR